MSNTEIKVFLNSVHFLVIYNTSWRKNKNIKVIMSYKITELESANLFEELKNEHKTTVVSDRVISSTIVTLEEQILTNGGTDSSIANSTTRKRNHNSALSSAEVRAIVSDFISVCSLWSMIFVVWLLITTPCVLIIYYFLHL
ncbi:hypothetical protein WA1_00045 [Scytonema hofmannii PCC 7110]|uniref:Uncharacterized protein n=2 Tax=Scytonema hofmannii TaxID=34078 RepID=A0A139XFY3_9CYAN|nr:hypothetical protein WA1_00045 [Scytonema hofmannii PCC 7110]